MKTYVGIDLHSNNNYIGVCDENDKRLYGKYHNNQLNEVLNVLKTFKKSIQGIVVESTYNWYWLIDGLQENGYKVHLANPSAIKVYEGLKQTNDKTDSYWLAHLLRLGILPEGYIYPKDERPVRDLLRRRMLFVKQRTAQILSLQSMINRNRGQHMSGNSIKQLEESFAEDYFEESYLNFTAKSQIGTIRFLGDQIASIEKEVLLTAKLKEEFKILQTIPGVGKVLSLTIMFEVCNIGRFPKVGNFSSYCRCVESKRISNGKTKGKNNSKNGNRYLAWAYVEAANFSKRYCQKAQKFYQRKASKTYSILATKALSNKLARASYYMMRDKIPYDVDKLFR
ncbi:MAG: transposase IS116/IS110/IS902 family protein [Candidatus Magnetoglobus multicellularis str. Araruama]|uniref:Transposase IS116/IS110/IS902 family protein n=1 Tax=Candidatus Magnetoglobus multicellularis str. Araruama TaxID=890399 RepID=A0A1V1P2Z5_9BACT|nr:MAG: transposase IS116/IS110/IS902 family protein [Candidatus Magnetoglobus multicellularis str. Araruama]